MPNPSNPSNPSKPATPVLYLVKMSSDEAMMRLLDANAGIAEVMRAPRLIQEWWATNRVTWDPVIPTPALTQPPADADAQLELPMHLPQETLMHLPQETLMHRLEQTLSLLDAELSALPRRT